MKQFSKIKALKIFLFAFLLFAAGKMNAQIGIGIANPAASAQLDVSSTTKGLLPPRMTQAQRDEIASPAAGLMIWCGNCGASGEIQVYNGSGWTNIAGGAGGAANVTIGTQVWMQKNLDVTTYRNGDPIPQVTDPAAWAGLTTGAWCYYNNDPSNGAVYGKLYNSFAVNDPRGLAPIGWEIPSDADWTNLTVFLGGPGVTGGKIKEAGTTHWSSPNTGATNESNFTGLPGGFRNSDGIFDFSGFRSYWWSSTEFNAGNAFFRYLLYDASSIDGGYSNRNGGYSVRCIREDAPIPNTNVIIGTQEWMQKNLDVTTYRNGDPIPQVTDQAEWNSLTTGAWCYYNNDPANGAVYGKLYNSYAINDPRGLAPAGWHVPTDEEWITLTNYLGGDLVAGGKLKEPGLSHWNSPNAGATNETGFTGLPGGYRDPSFNGFVQIGDYIHFWSSTSLVNYFLTSGDSKLYRQETGGSYGFAVRCVRD